MDGGQAARHRDEAAAGQQQKGHCPRVYTQPHPSAQGPRAGPSCLAPLPPPSPSSPFYTPNQPPPLVVTALLADAKIPILTGSHKQGFNEIKEEIMTPKN